MKTTDRIKYRSQFGHTYDCLFKATRYASNGNLALILVDAETEERILTATVNTDIALPDDRIAVKDYSENAGVADFLKGLGIIQPTEVVSIPSGWVEIPVFELTESGKELFEGV